MTSKNEESTRSTSTTLPSLPKIRRTLERTTTSEVLDWFRNNYHGSCVLEIKATAGNSIPASALAPHQKEALVRASIASRGIVWKIPDTGMHKKPFDAFCLKGISAFVVPVFTKHRVFFMIPVEEWSGARFEMNNYQRHEL